MMPSRGWGPFPAVGEHTDAILAELGYDGPRLRNGATLESSEQRRAGPFFGPPDQLRSHVADQPPSTGNTDPVMSAPSGPHRNTISAAT